MNNLAIKFVSFFQRHRIALKFFFGRLILFVTLIGSYFVTFGQGNTTVSGKVTESKTGEALPYVNIYFKGSAAGTTTDEQGNYTLKTSEDYDTLVASFIGYKTKLAPVNIGNKQVIDFELEEDRINLNEVVVYSGENPAWAIIRKVVEHKKNNDKESLVAYDYDSYNKIELDINQISPNLQKKKIVTKVTEAVDSASLPRDSRGVPLLPIFFSESFSRYFVKNNPYAHRENVEKTRISGLAIEDGSLTSQIVGASYQEYNFYRNWLNILNKDFVSPIADGWRMYYDFDIIDTVQVDNRLCFELKVIPNREEDPAFHGTIWITTDDFALKKVDLLIDRSSNLNFVKKIWIKQDLGKTTLGPWLPKETAVEIEVGQIVPGTAGFRAKFYNATKDWKLNELKPDKFYEQQVVLNEDVTNSDDSYWQQARYEGLTREEQQVAQVIDTIKHVPIVKTYVDIIKVLADGYVKVGKIDVGPYLYAYAYNNFEGSTFRLGGKTNADFSRRLVFRGYFGYGFQDKQWKYGAHGEIIIKRFPWTTLEISSVRDAEQVGLRSEDLEDNYIFYAATRWSRFIRPYYHSDNKITFQTDIAKGLSYQLVLRNQYFDMQFPFYYYKNPGQPDSPLGHNFAATSFTISTRWARDELFLQDDNERISLGTVKSPEIELSYTYGMDGVLGGNFEYHKIEAGIGQNIKMGLLGTSYYHVRAGYIFGQLPYPLLENHIGNESWFYTDAAYNTMNYFEFVSDSYVDLRYQHSFNGLILNKIPVMRKLKWRLVGSFNALYGNLRQENVEIMSDTDPNGVPTLDFHGLNSTPYLEIGYGVENIFKFFRVDCFHRLTYRNMPDAQNFTIKLSAQFKL